MMLVFGIKIFLEVALIGLVALICFPVRWLVFIFAKYFTTELVEIVSTRDSQSASFGPTTADMNIVICMTLDGSVPTKKLKKLFQSRIIEAKDSNGISEYDRLKWTWTFFFGYAFWKRTNFKLEEHFREYDLKNDLSLPSPCWEKDLEHVLGSLIISKWDARRSPWEILVVQNYFTACELSGYDDSVSTEIIIRASHLLMDGRNWGLILRRWFDVQAPFPRFTLKSSGESWYQHILMWLQLPIDFIEMSRRLRIKNQPGAELPFPPRLVVSIGKAISVKRIHDIKSGFGVSHAAVIQSIVIGALERFLERANIPVPEEMTSAYVVPMPTQHKSVTGNHFLITIIPWRIKSPSLVDRLMDVDGKLNEIRESVAPIGLHCMYWLLSFIPIKLRSVLMAGTFRAVSLTESNFPVLQLISKDSGIVIKDMFFLVSPVPGTGISNCIGGANGNHRFVTVFDKSLLSDINFSAAFRSCIEAEVAKLVEHMN